VCTSLYYVCYYLNCKNFLSSFFLFSTILQSLYLHMSLLKSQSLTHCKCAWVINAQKYKLQMWYVALHVIQLILDCDKIEIISRFDWFDEIKFYVSFICKLHSWVHVCNLHPRAKSVLMLRVRIVRFNHDCVHVIMPVIMDYHVWSAILIIYRHLFQESGIMGFYFYTWLRNCVSLWRFRLCTSSQ